MTVTLTASYKEILSTETVDNIQEWCIDGDFELNDALEFIHEHGENDFNTYYEDYIDQGEKVGYPIVDAFVGENGFCDVEHVEDAYAGTFRDTDDFVEDLIESTGDLDNLPVYVVVDFKATWDRGLSYDYDAIETDDGYVHIFRKYY